MHTENLQIIRMAMAVDYNGQLTPGYFGNADKYFIYESGSKGIIFLKEEINPYKDADKESEHCSVKKGRLMMELTCLPAVTHQAS